MASAIGKLRKAGINIEKPNINKSAFVFKPDVENNTIYFGLKGISRINNNLILEIIQNRPYTSIEDLLEKVKLNKIQITMLIKAGMFDELYPNKTRLQLIYEFCARVAETKKRLTLQNLSGLVDNNFIPDEFADQIKVFKITRHIRKWFKQTSQYVVDENMLNYIQNTTFSGNIVPTAGGYAIDLKEWDKYYKAQMEPIKAFISSHEAELLTNYNALIVGELVSKYCPETIESGELEALSFYYTNHELSRPEYSAWLDQLGVVDFYDLPPEPTIVWEKENTNIRKYKTCRIYGTAIGRDKTKRIVGLLTPKGFVKIKVWQAQFVKYDRQLKINGTTDKSWFTKGTRLIINGYRDDDYFIPKVYKKDAWQHPFSKIIKTGELLNTRPDEEIEL